MKIFPNILGDRYTCNCCSVFIQCSTSNPRFLTSTIYVNDARFNVALNNSVHRNLTVAHQCCNWLKFNASTASCTSVSPTQAFHTKVRPKVNVASWGLEIKWKIYFDGKNQHYFVVLSGNMIQSVSHAKKNSVYIKT